MKKYPILAVSVPIVVAIAVGYIIACSNITSISFVRFEFLLNTIITTSATISGFILASVTILVGATSSAIMKDIRNKGGLRELQWRYVETLILGFVVIVYFTLLGAVVEAEYNSIGNGCLSFSAGLLVAYLCSTVSTCYYLLSIIGMLYYDPPVCSTEASSPEGPFRFGSD